jgi:hypothetical protein
MRGQLARHTEQHPRILVCQSLFATREKSLAGLTCRDVQVEKEAGAVLRGNLTYPIRDMFPTSTFGRFRKLALKPRRMFFGYL